MWSHVTWALQLEQCPLDIWWLVLCCLVSCHCSLVSKLAAGPQAARGLSNSALRFQPPPRELEDAIAPYCVDLGFWSDAS